MFTRVGDNFFFEGNRYTCIDATDMSNSEKCQGCAFRLRCTQEEIDLDCIKSLREDGKSVYFKLLPEPEPYKMTKSVLDIFRLIYSKYPQIIYKRGDNFNSSIEVPGVINIYFRKGVMIRFQDVTSGTEYSCEYYYLRDSSKALLIFDRYGKVGEIKIDKN